MNRLSAIIHFIKEKRAILAPTFLVIGILSSTLTVIIAMQRPQIIRSRASEPSAVLENLVEFKSPKGIYQLTYDQRLWQLQNLADQAFDSRILFILNKEYGLARLDIIEGESDQELNSLISEIIKKTATPAVLADSTEQVQFQGKSAFSVKYKEDILGQNTYYYQYIIKDGKKFLIVETRAPKLGYNQQYIDNLLENISFNGSHSTSGVKGIAELSANLNTVELVDLVRPSIANIVYVYCLEVVNVQPALSNLSQPKYNFCGLSKGSGFVVNENGIVATNGHVVKVYPEEGLVINLLNEGSKDFALDLIKGVHSSTGQTLNKNQLEDFYKQINANPHYLDLFLTQIFELVNKKALVINISYEKHYINLGGSPVKVDYQKLNIGDAGGSIIGSDTTYSANLLDFNYPNRYSFEAIINDNYQRGADVALLQINNSSNPFPAVELGSIKDLREGSEVIVLGHPTLVEGALDPRSAISYKSSTKPTATKGIISAVKEDVTGKTILQTDASIDHGNSGGPAFDSSGQVIGIATFMSESKTGNFNFLRDISELKDLMSKNKIDNQLGELTTVWRKGLDNFRKRYYTQAIKDFNQVKSLSHSHPTANEFITLSQEGIEEGKSLEGLTGFIRGGKGSGVIMFTFGSIALVNFMLAGFMMVLPLFRQEEV